MNYLRLDDFTVPGFGLRAEIGWQFKDKDASGGSSSTSTAEKGEKRKKLNVEIFVRYTEESELRELIRIAEAKERGKLKVYTVTNGTGNAAGMRQARFTGDFKAAQQEERRCWLVTFTLAEHISVAERAEAREKPKDEAAQQNEGEVVDAQPEETPETQEDAQLTYWEKVLKSANEEIGGFESGAQ